MNLYHYTDQSGMMGIVGKAEIWATKIQYLNDDNEYKIAFKIAKDYLEELFDNEESQEQKFRIRRLIHNLESVANMNVCVCSLSEKGDLLSQWRGYSKSLGGYSIGFNKEKLEEHLSSINFDLKKCIYLLDAQKKLVRSEIDAVLMDYKNKKEPNCEDGLETLSSPCADKLCERLSLIAPTIKDSSFSEEQEWRIISRGGKFFSDLDFRAGKSMLIPFFKIALPPHSARLIKNIIVGHTPHIDLARSATEAFVSKIYGHISPTRPKVQKSSIPFRNW